MDRAKVVLLTNAVATLFMVGLIWMVQVVHYPLFDAIGDQHYVDFQQRHQSSITLIVGPMMIIELITSVLLIRHRLENVSKSVVYSGVLLVATIWLSTALVQVPCHERLVRGFDQAAYDWLVQSNWIRTVAWTLRGAIVTWMLSRILFGK